jgi:signal transduction histidine kinase
MRAIGIVWDFFKARGHHVVFAVSILSMGLLITWWSVFLNQSINLSRQQRYAQLELKMEVLALSAGSKEAVTPAVGIHPADSRFEILKSIDRAPGKDALPLEPHWGDFSIRPTTAATDAIERDFRSKRLMVTGEGSLLFLLLLAGLILMYKYIRLEKRTTREATEFWNRLTHEIKTPITGIKSFLQSIKNRSIDSANLEPLVDLALQQVMRQEKLAENILAGSRLRDHSSRVAVSPVDARAFVENYFREALHLTEADVELDFDLRGVRHMVVDEPSLKVIMDNITENAVKYGPKHLRLSLRIHDEGNKIVLDFSDNGPGFHPSLRKNIFSAFKVIQNRPADIPHGTGMGLYISRELAHEMGGLLTAESGAELSGARLRLTLPGVKGS